MGALGYSGRVVVVTGAGRGIGRAYAALLAARGAAVVVNDLGVAVDGGGRDCGLAGEVADDLCAAGSVAVPDGSDVATAEGAGALVEHALERFGRIDSLVLNAGIFDVDSFPEVNFGMLERHFAVHVGGSFHVARAAWRTMVEQRFGRVVLTTSTSSFGAANTVAYTTAKSAVIGLGRALALSGADHGIKVNMVAPTAGTRMMARGMGSADLPTDRSKAPELVAPLVAVLAHECCPTNGQIYGAGLRRFNRIVSAANAGYSAPTLTVTPESVLEHWTEIVASDHLEPVADVMAWARFNNGLIADLVED